MLTNEIIKDLAKKNQTTELNVRREYFQHLFLAYFFAEPKAAEVYFKGGTALRIIYGSPRFSEDLDFSSKIKGIPDIERLVVKTLEGIERESVNIDIEESKMTSGGYLANLFFNKTAVRLQISLRETKSSGEAVTIVNDFLPSYTIVQLAQEQLVDEKISALLIRGKPRDFYDLYFILRADLLPANRRDILPETLTALKKSPTRFDKELGQFLPRSHWAIVRNFRGSLEREIKRFL